MEDEEFDRPLFKRLSHNDSGASEAHQAGILIPKDLAKYFPTLTQMAGVAAPDHAVRAELFVENTPVGVVTTRYQHQTWDNERSPERRLTSNLTPMRSHSEGGDLMVVWRSLKDPDFYRIQLLKKGSARFKALEKSTAGRKWGAVDVSDPPVSEKAVEDALEEQKQHEGKSLELFDNTAAMTETRVRKVARSRAFGRRVMDLYSSQCAVCSAGMMALSGSPEVQAAHIVPRSMKGADDARNGLALCRTHHWAFDFGLFGIRPGGAIHVPAPVLARPENAPLAPFDTKILQPPTNAAFRPAEEAFSWHMDNIVLPGLV